MDMSLTEAIALAVAVLMALALVSFLVTVKLAQSGMGPTGRRQVLVSLWLLIVGLVALLLALRALSGGPLVEGAPSTGIWLGLQPRQVVALALAIVLLVVGYARLRRILEPLEGQPPVMPASDAPTPPVDETEL